MPYPPNMYPIPPITNPNIYQYMAQAYQQVQSPNQYLQMMQNYPHITSPYTVLSPQPNYFMMNSSNAPANMTNVIPQQRDLSDPYMPISLNNPPAQYMSSHLNQGAK